MAKGNQDQCCIGSGNVDADLGFADHEIELAKAELARQIGAGIDV